MSQENQPKNVIAFSEEAASAGGYLYTKFQNYSARFAGRRWSRAIRSKADFSGKRVLDVGCGDGAFSLEYLDWGAESVLGVDPAVGAIEVATKRTSELGLADKAEFRCLGVYELEQLKQKFDIVVLRAVVHHLPNRELGIKAALNAGDCLIGLEPNGDNPVVRWIARNSEYHVEREVRVFTLADVGRWVERSGGNVLESEFVNLVPVFMPRLPAIFFGVLTPVVERIPVLRSFMCGQIVYSASIKK